MQKIRPHFGRCSQARLLSQMRLPAKLFCTNPPTSDRPISGKETDSKSTEEGLDKERERTESNEEAQDELVLLYDAVLNQVHEHGWTDRAIEAAVSELGWSPAAKRMVARGPVQVAEEFISRCNKKLAETLSLENEKDAAAAGGIDPVGRATFAIRERLEMIEPYHHNWARALALQALPQNSSRALKSSALLVDEIAHYAGYRSADISWYTDRAVVGLGYHTTELYWLTDKSPGKTDTWRFLEDRLRDSHNLRKRITSTYENFMTLSDAATGSVSTILRSVRRSY